VVVQEGGFMHRYLVVANQTLGGSHLEQAVRDRVAQGECTFHIVVPATRPADHLVWTEGEAHEIARERLEQAMEWFKAHGASCTAEIGDARPMLAIGDALVADRFDEIILSTLPIGMSRWLRQDLPARVRREFGVPVTHVIGPAVRTHARSA
jgi:hypothetical protein